MRQIKCFVFFECEKFVDKVLNFRRDDNLFLNVNSINFIIMFVLL